MSTVLIRGGHVVTMDPDLGDLPDTDVLVRDSRIVDVAPNLPTGGAEMVEAGGRIVIPGLVDGHRHAWQCLLHGLATDWGFPTYMRLVRGGYGGCFDAEDAYLANLVGGLESISVGITTLVDHSHLQATAEIGTALVRGLWDSGVGGYFAYALQNAPDWLGDAPATPEALADLLTRAPDPEHDERFRGVRKTLADLDQAGTNRLRLGVALPEAAPYLPLDVVRPLLERARSLEPALVTGHWNALVHGGRYVSTLAQLVEDGFFDGVTVLSHCNQLDEADLDVMARAHIGLVTTPGTEGGMGLGPYLASRLVGRGGAAALGADTTCYAQADILGEARALLDAERRDAAAVAGGIPQEVLPARAALDLATIIGARAVGLHDEVGSLTPGKRANVTVVFPDPIRASPGSEPAVTLLHYTGSGDVETVLVDGEIRKRAGELVGVDTAGLARRCGQSRDAIRSRYAALPADVVDGAWRGVF
ncbi:MULTISPECIES: amidohydrolase family protein [Streptomyces]|uniref:amidohydrolase family protein n=1 Tax=Streptomyces lycopersici TaxID=2974589 RepID=UPI0021D0622A|nr:amidohydrolase family protein [Streptomyces sp. NEAU-383]